MSRQHGTGSPDAAAPEDPFLLYDGECPFCSYYVAKSRFEARIGRPLALIDGRQAPGPVARLREEGFDLERGMILVLDGRTYHGAAALAALEAPGGGTGPFGALTRWLAGSPRRAAAAYPWLRLLRRAALLAKGKRGFGG